VRAGLALLPDLLCELAGVPADYRASANARIPRFTVVCVIREHRMHGRAGAPDE